MTRRSKKNRALAAMRDANPASAHELREEIDGETLAREMRQAMTRGRAPSQPIPAGARVAAEYDVGAGFVVGRRRLALGLGAGLACLAAIAALLLFGGGSVGGTGQPAYAAAAVEVAEANPRLLVTEPGWSVADAGEFEAGEGEVTFSDVEHRFTVHWYPARYYRRYLRDRSMVSRPVRSVLLGREATTVRYYRGPEGAEYATMLAPEGPVFVEVRGRLETSAEYDSVLRSLRPVSVEAWLAAMPRSVVVPEARAAAIRRMLQGVPLPPDFDRAALEGEASVLNHYQLAARVAGVVSCGWVESWLAATEVGEEPAAREAVRAMATWPRWPMIAFIDGGGWAANVKAAARAIATGKVKRGPAGSVIHPDGSGYELGPAWAVMLNCSEHYWRRAIDESRR